MEVTESFRRQWKQVKPEPEFFKILFVYQKEALATTTATAAKTSLKKWIRASSNFIALIPTRLIR